MRSRAHCRSCLERAKVRAKFIIKHCQHNWLADAHNPKRKLGLFARTPVPCSCTMCGNPRRHFKDRTLQELKADAAFRSQIEEQ
jgi:hypothetical protein